MRQDELASGVKGLGRVTWVTLLPVRGEGYGSAAEEGGNLESTQLEVLRNVDRQ